MGKIVAAGGAANVGEQVVPAKASARASEELRIREKFKFMFALILFLDAWD
jgi:hypothetical protein